MKINFKSAIGGAAALSMAAGMMLVGASSAYAAAPTFEPDPNAQGTLSFYDAAGNQVTSGNVNDTPLAYFYATSSLPTQAGDTAVVAQFATPVDGTIPALWPTPETWTTTQLSTHHQTPGSTDPNGAAYPASIKALPGAVVVDDSGLPFQLHIDTFTSASSQNPNVYQVRVISAPSQLQYWTADILVDPASGDWTQVYPAVATSTSISAISASPASPISGSQPVSLSATLTAGDGSHPAGSVNLFDGATDLGAATFNAATGAISANVTPALGAHSYKFTFTPADLATYSGSSSPVLPYTVDAIVDVDTQTVVTGSTTGTVGTAQPIVATVSTLTTAGSSVPAGTPVATGAVQFQLDGVNVGGPIGLDAAGTATLSYNPADTSAHTITATFVPAAGSHRNPSSDTVGVVVTATAPAYAPDPQTFKVNVPAGTLVISTPYTPANPFDLGVMTLSADGTHYTSTPANFGDPAAVAGTDPGNLPGASETNGVTITDTRAASTGWNASIQTSDFADGAPVPHTISGDGLAFTSVTPKFLPGNVLDATNVSTADATLFKAAPKQFATATAGPGTVNVTGVMTLTAPSSSVAGDYTATVTFSVV